MFVDDIEMVNLRQNALHGLKIEALAGHLFRSLVFLDDRLEPVGFTLGPVDTLGSITVRLLDNLFGTAAGVILLISLLNLVVVLGLPIHWQYAMQGVVLVAATALQGFRQFLLSR